MPELVDLSTSRPSSGVCQASLLEVRRQYPARPSPSRPSNARSWWFSMRTTAWSASRCSVSTSRCVMGRRSTTIPWASRGCRISSRTSPVSVPESVGKAQGLWAMSTYATRPHRASSGSYNCRPPRRPSRATPQSSSRRCQRLRRRAARAPTPRRLPGRRRHRCPSRTARRRRARITTRRRHTARRRAAISCTRSCSSLSHQHRLAPGTILPPPEIHTEERLTKGPWRMPNTRRGRGAVIWARPHPRGGSTEAGVMMCN